MSLKFNMAGIINRLSRENIKKYIIIYKINIQKMSFLVLYFNSLVIFSRNNKKI